MPASSAVTFSQWLTALMAGTPVGTMYRSLRVVSGCVGCLAIVCGGAQHKNRNDGGAHKSR
jgi:hypothetical protein